MNLEAIFPGLQGANYLITSPAETQYNCVAWAIGTTADWWWPDAASQFFWPAGITRDLTLPAFEELFAAHGYVVCQLDALEPGFEKIAVFATPDHRPQHAARQLASGRWTSKLGMLEDIEHDLHHLAGGIYGSVVLLMKRPDLTVA